MGLKFEVLTDTKKYISRGELMVEVCRIRALQDFTVGLYGQGGLNMLDIREVHKGDIGGWVEDENNLAQDGPCWIFDDAIACNDSRLMDASVAMNEASISGDSVMKGYSIISDHAYVCKESVLKGFARVSGRAYVENGKLDNRADIRNNVHIRNTTVTNEALVMGDMILIDSVVTGTTTIFRDSIVLENAYISGNPDEILLIKKCAGQDYIAFYRNITPENNDGSTNNDHFYAQMSAGAILKTVPMCEYLDWAKGQEKRFFNEFISAYKLAVAAFKRAYNYIGE